MIKCYTSLEEGGHRDRAAAMADVSYQISLPVQNVQALAAASHGVEELPSRYIRSEAEVEKAVHVREVEIPVIDLGRLLDPELSGEESIKLGLACEEWGFFQLINHGVPEMLIAQVRAAIEEFFDLPLEKKKEHAQLPNSLEGYGQAFVVSEDQKLDWADMIYLVTRPIPMRNMRFWPSHPPSFRATLDTYSSELRNVARCLLVFIAKNLGLEPERFLEIFKDQPQGLRMNYYPPCSKADKVLGISPHTDATGLTLLLQANDVQGLQIKKDNKWVQVEPLNSAFVVNIGDFLEILSNGKYRSVEHRAVINTKNKRLSIAAFHDPTEEAMLGPLPELVKDGKEHYKTMSYESYTQTYLSSKLDGRSLLDSIRQE